MNRKPNNKMNSRQLVALLGVILLVAMYLITLILAIVDSSSSGKLFVLSLCCTVIVPMIVFLYNWMYGRLTGKKVVGDPSQDSTENEM